MPTFKRYERLGYEQYATMQHSLQECVFERIKEGGCVVRCQTSQTWRNYNSDKMQNGLDNWSMSACKQEY